MGNNYIIGIDVGTSTVKCVLFASGGRELLVTQKPVRLIYPGPGLVEQSMNEVWDSVVSCIEELAQNTTVSLTDVAAIGITAQGDGLWCVGYEGEAVGNAISWMDGRAMEKCTGWYTDGTDEKIYSILGSTFYPGSHNCLASWCVENDPERMEDTKWICCCKDWIKFKMTGELTTDDSFSILADIKTHKQDDRLLDIYGIRSIQDKIPPIKSVFENHAPLDKYLAAQIGLPPGIPVFGGPFDVSSSAVGVGSINPGDSCVIVGTTSMVEIVQDDANTQPINVGYTLNHAVPNRWIRAFGVMAGTPNLDWGIANFGHKYKQLADKNGTTVYYEIEKAVGALSIGADGLIYHPYISPAGERAPFVKPTAKAQFFGISADHTTDHMMRAIYEGVGYSIMDCFEHSLTKPKELRISGGGAKSKFWCQMFADMTGIDVIVPSGTEYGAKGAAIVAGTALGLYSSIEEAVNNGVHAIERFVPDHHKVEKYKRFFSLYKSIYQNMWDDWDYRASILDMENHRSKN